MPWKKETLMSQRKEFVSLARGEGVVFSRLCERFGISRKTGYKWLDRSSDGNQEDWAADRSRRPHSSPNRTAEVLENAALAVRDNHPVWGGRKIRKVLQTNGLSAVPVASTITEILRRHGRLNPAESLKRGPLRRFERKTPNELWQMDFKGPVATAQGPCHPLTIIDDCSRYALCVAACRNQDEQEVRQRLIEVFRLYGLPQRILSDNGPPWGNGWSRYTRLGAWLIRLSIGISHGRPYHPQTQGKDERFNRTLGQEAIAGREFRDGLHCQGVFDRFRHCYNHERPHEALDLAIPASRYQPSRRDYPEALPPIEYDVLDITRKVGPAGYIAYHGRRYQVGRAFTGHAVALRPTDRGGIVRVFFCHQAVATLDLNQGKCRQH